MAGMRYPLSVIPGYYASRPGIQIGTQLDPSASDDDIRFVKQLGIDWVTTGFSESEEHTVEAFVALREQFARHGLQIYRLNLPCSHTSPEIVLGLPGRDEHIAEFLDYIRNLSAAGIYYATFAHMANEVWRTGRETVRGGATHSAFRLNEVAVRPWRGAAWDGEFTHGRAYSEEELWDAYTYFIRQVVPVAEEAGVYLGAHTDDPPVYTLGGVPRCIFGSFEGSKRAVEIADSPNVGLHICVGSWMEGGEAMGADVVEAIRHFGGMKKLFHIHFRNVTAPMPEGFVETFLDDGYTDMYQVMRVLREVAFDGVIISDHRPRMVGGNRASEGFAVGYMRALVQAVNQD